MDRPMGLIGVLVAALNELALQAGRPDLVIDKDEVYRRAAAERERREREGT